MSAAMIVECVKVPKKNVIYDTLKLMNFAIALPNLYLLYCIGSNMFQKFLLNRNRNLDKTSIWSP